MKPKSKNITYESERKKSRSENNNCFMLYDNSVTKWVMVSPSTSK